ncbi:MAG: hypothetical protein H2040_10480 [Euryhalocaulis sp.]|uniref:hypothetical protein n=1 Tax=Euryhalocaulis sp. TaxID=2744307 RepID=UPI0018098361|nr:hypothetical protein [Euryhalocaulis sp.]MBA4802278.1 hypothetical protein [Euryhalocaulis sp.]
MISVTQTGSGDPMAFDVTVAEGGGQTRHSVTLARADYQRLGAGAAPDRVIDAAFRFLLDREPKEAILAAFDIMVITRYFPEFERQLPGYLA